MNTSTRISRKELEEVGNRLSDRDKDIIEALRKFRFLTTNQIKRLFFIDSANASASHRAANRALIKLQDYGLIYSLKRRVGGVRAGSASYVWSLSPTGHRLLQILNPDKIENVRKRTAEPSARFLEHVLVVSEAYLQISHLTRENEGFNLLTFDVEPECWRTYLNDGGVPKILKPDTYVVTISGEYEDHCFFEIDLDTESPCRIVKKSTQYCRYYVSGTEQKINDVFPLVVWIAPSQKRAESLRRHINEQIEENQKKLFLIITPDQLKKLLIEGADCLENEANTDTETT